jgi:hypothetical protein
MPPGVPTYACVRHGGTRSSTPFQQHEEVGHPPVVLQTRHVDQHNLDLGVLIINDIVAG